ncbi:MAG: hypothetical protein OXG65_02370 [Chloroflexi bacterium]|nr:hypothetical protein [Chloroflexota bacterium]
MLYEHAEIPLQKVRRSSGTAALNVGDRQPTLAQDDADCHDLPHGQNVASPEHILSRGVLSALPYLRELWPTRA